MANERKIEFDARGRTFTIFSPSHVYEGTWEELAAYEPELRGRKLRLIVIPDTLTTLSLQDRRAFLKLSLEERRNLLAQQAERMTAHYESDTQWRELQVGDIVEY